MGVQGRFHLVITPPFRRQIPYLVILALFLFVAVTATIFGLEPQRGLIALCGLMLVAGLGYCISLRVLADPDPGLLILRSVTIAMIVWLIFCIGGAIAWSHGVFRLEEEPATSLASLFAPTATLFWIPRLSGYSLDSNRAGFILVMYLALLDRFVPATSYRRYLRLAVAFFILIAVSRSAMLCWLAYYLFSSGFWKRVRSSKAALRLTTVGVLLMVVGFIYREEIATAAELWQVSDIVSDRLSRDPTSTAGSHVQLIQRGFETWMTSSRTLLAGIGFAGSPRVLGDFFGDNKYGNFHDLYVSVLAELGLPAFLLLMILLFYPMRARRGAAPFIAAIAAFNIFLQSFLEPILWVSLALVWSFEPWIPRRRPQVSGDISISQDSVPLT